MTVTYSKLGSSDLQVSNICLGTMTFGQQNSEAEGHQQFNYARSRGINFIDTAEMYPVPPRAETVHSTEKIVGSWLRTQPRDQIILATKMTGGSRGMAWVRDGNHAFNRNNLRRALEGSLQRLQTDYVDLYQLHWPERNTPMFGNYLFNPEEERDFTPFAETLEALAELVDEGKIRHVGLSNEWPWGLMQFLNASQQHGLPRVVSLQNAYNLINRSYDTALREMGYRENVPLLAYSPLAFGHLSAKYLRDASARGRVNIFDGFAQRYEKPAVEPAIRAYAALADSVNLSPATLALAFVYSRWFTASTIIGATSMAQLEENIAAASVEWNSELEEAVEAIHLQFFNPAP
jgi:aryl-alcohol dehydrogenase-like predicted oxidoreductase